MSDTIPGIAPSLAGAIARGIVGTSADAPVIRTMAEAGAALGDPAGWPPELREAVEALLPPAARVPFVRTPSRCTCGTIIPCDAQETAR